MLSRGTATLSRNVHQPSRGMATAQQLSQRISSVKNIKKITSAMKMVAVCKLRAAQDILDRARIFSRSMEEVFPEPKNPPEVKSELFVGISSDRGLCGAINSSISRSLRDEIYKRQEEGLEDVKVVLIGEKCKQGLERLFANKFVHTLSETGKFAPCTFKQCGELTDHWTQTEADRSAVFFQYFKSMISYITTKDHYWSYDAIKDEMATSMAEYEVEGDADTLRNLHEFRASVKLFHYLAENETSTLSARMTAMDNSSSNATDMIDSLTLILNRNRQAKITTELSEIISGAAALED